MIAKTDAPTVACIFLEQWDAKYEVPSTLLSETGPQFVLNSFVAVCSALEVNNITTTEYRPQINGKTERFNSTLILLFCHYGSKQHIYCDINLLPVTCAHNVQYQRSVKGSRSAWRLSQPPPPPGPATVSPSHANLVTNDDMASSMYARLKLIKRATDVRQEADKNLRLELRQYKNDYSRRIRFAPVFLVGDYIFLNRPPLSLSDAERRTSEGYNQLLLRKQGPYIVIGVNKTSLRILQDALENVVSNHRATLSPTSRRNCDKAKRSTKQEPRSEIDSK